MVIEVRQNFIISDDISVIIIAKLAIAVDEDVMIKTASQSFHLL
jgi:hypothetical protein